MIENTSNLRNKNHKKGNKNKDIKLKEKGRKENFLVIDLVA